VDPVPEADQEAAAEEEQEEVEHGVDGWTARRRSSWQAHARA